MLTYELTVWLIFRLIDSLILIALAVWAFSRWGLPAFRRRIAHEFEEKKNVQDAVHELKEQAQQLDMQLELDTHDIERLEQKIRLWQQAVKRKQMRDLVEKEDILVRLHKLDEQRLHNVRHKKFYATALTEAVDKAEHALVHEPTKGEATVKTLLKFMASREAA